MIYWKVRFRLCPVKCFLISKTISAHKIHNSLVYETNTILKQLISKLFTFFSKLSKSIFNAINSIQFNSIMQKSIFLMNQKLIIQRVSIRLFIQVVELKNIFKSMWDQPMILWSWIIIFEIVLVYFILLVWIPFKFIFIWFNMKKSFHSIKWNIVHMHCCLPKK